MDRYTKGVLTVIAAALVAIVVQNAIPQAQALNGPCGLNSFNPCYVTTDQFGLKVQIAK